MLSSNRGRNRIERGRLVVNDERLSGAEELRLCVSNMNVVSESFNDQFTTAQLLQIHRMHILSEWDIYPDKWTTRQLREALKGKPPMFDDNERPIYKVKK
jgi:hypothetical protein